MNATLTFLGTGTSMGIPTLGCECAVCARPSLRRPLETLEIAAPARPSGSPGQRAAKAWRPHRHRSRLPPPAIRENLRRIDAVFYTHPHADHILGLDDLRPLTFYLPEPLPLFADDQTADAIERVFDYTFRPPTRGTTIARVHLHRFTSPEEEIELYGATFRRIPVNHGKLAISGYRFGSAAYLTDMSSIPEESAASSRISTSSS